VAGDGLQEREARGAFLGQRLLGEEHREIGGLGGVEHRLRRSLERPVPGPQLEPAVCSRVLDGREQLRTLRREGLVDDDEDALAILQAASLDEVLRPARVGHPRLPRLHRRSIVRQSPSGPQGMDDLEALRRQVVNTRRKSRFTANKSRVPALFL
jgi:hypothetical protein